MHVQLLMCKSHGIGHVAHLHQALYKHMSLHEFTINQDGPSV